MNRFNRVTQTKATIMNYWNDEEPLYHSSIDIEGDRVYSVSSGIVLQVGKDESGWMISIQYDVSTIVRYGHLKSSLVDVGDRIENGQNLGRASKFVVFEYATLDNSNTMWPVRIGEATYYKHDPQSLLYDDILPDSNISKIQYMTDSEFPDYTFTDAQIAEFGKDEIPPYE